MTLRISDQWAGWIEEELPALAMGDDVSYELGMIMIQTGPEMQAPAMAVCLFTPGIVIGTRMHIMAVLPNLGAVDRDGIVGLLTGMLEGLRQQRSQQAQMPAQEPSGSPSASNGQGSLPGGLHSL